MRASTDKPEMLVLWAGSLCSKWGFEDGDLLWNEPYAGWLERDGVSLANDHPALCALVERFLLPVLPVPVVVERISSCHNPIRATMIDGVEWDSHTADAHPALNDFSVHVPWSEALAVIISTNMGSK